MKITFPECQIELTANEAITMYDYFHMKDSGVQLLKEIDRYRDMLGSVDERPKNTYNKPQEEEGLKSSDFRPAVNEGDKDFSIEEFFTPEPEAEEGENQQSDLDACLAEIEARNKEPYQPSRKIE